MSALLGCLGLLLISAPLCQRSEAISQENRPEPAPPKSFQQHRNTYEQSSQTQLASINSAQFGGAGSAFKRYSASRPGSSIPPEFGGTGSAFKRYSTATAGSSKRARIASDEGTPSTYDESQTRRAPINSAQFGGAGSAFRAFSAHGAGSSQGVHTPTSASTESSVYTEGGADISRGSREIIPVFSKGPPRPPKGPGEERAPGAFPCPHCPKSYGYKRSLKAHLKSHETDETKCPVCHKTFTMKANLKGHIIRSHPGTPVPEKADRGRPITRDSGPFKCSQCGNEYQAIYTLRKHEKSHETLETHCFECKQTFSNRGSYRVHLQRRHPKEALEMEEADNRRYLEEHPEVCGVCKKRFKNAESLYEHRLSHEGKTQCDICGLVLSRRSALYTHRWKCQKKAKEN